MSENKGINLRELLSRIRRSIAASFPGSVWIKAEISSIKTNYSGHCYMDLTDREDAGGQDMPAVARAVVWRSSWRIISAYFREVTGVDLEVGMSVLLKVQVSYSEAYGLSLVVNEIDPSFTLGESERLRLEVISRLRSEGMFEMNTQLELPALPRRFAVISSPTAAGYRDFVKHLSENEYGFHFDITLFQAPMQGASAPDGIIAALDKVLETDESSEEHFDAVMIIRGGGSKSDLACFDDYNLAVHVAQFPLPVMIAVGHDIDYHVVDMVAAVSVKTPTAMADYLINTVLSRVQRVAELAQRLRNAVSLRIRGEEERVSRISASLVHVVGGRMKDESLRLNNYRNRCMNAMGNAIRIQYSRLDLLEKRVALGNPYAILSQGYALLYKDDRRLSDFSVLRKGDEMTVAGKNVKIQCLVTDINRLDNGEQ